MALGKPNIPSATVLTLGNKMIIIVLYCKYKIVSWHTDGINLIKKRKKKEEKKKKKKMTSSNSIIVKVSVWIQPQMLTAMLLVDCK